MQIEEFKDTQFSLSLLFCVGFVYISN